MTDSANVENRIRLMAFTNRHSALLATASWCVFAAAMGIAIFVLFSLSHPSGSVLVSSGEAAPAAGGAAMRSGALVSLGDLDWSVLGPAPSDRGRGGGALAGRFRLAGTFLEYGASVENKRRAILDDLEAGTQSILSEGEAYDHITVLRVLSDRVVLRSGDVEETLWLTFSGSAGPGGADAALTPQTGDGGQSNSEPGRFGGKRVGENRWVFERAALMAYYRELMDSPDRLVKVFDSLHPLYAQDNRISGYVLQIEGEPEFFDAVGFIEGDVVRSVNSVDMTNRRRAEFFIRQFAEGKASAFVLEIERNGLRQKLIYQVR